MQLLLRFSALTVFASTIAPGTRERVTGGNFPRTPRARHSRSPDGWDQIPQWAGGWACTSHLGVLGSIPKQEELQCAMGRLVHTGLAHVLHYPPPPTPTAL